MRNTRDKRQNQKGFQILEAFLLEATGGFEPPNEAFAEPCLTTWPRRQYVI
jgi:hypothetical protein